MDDDHKRRAKELDAQRKHRRAAVYQRVHRMRQWGVLRDLRKKFYERHNEFQKLATCAEPPVRLFAKRCKRPGGLLRLGILTFKKILRGRSPKTLFEVFAFISLPYAMATVMHGRGIQVEFAPRICDFSTWKESIIDIDELLRSVRQWVIWPIKPRHWPMQGHSRIGMPIGQWSPRHFSNHQCF
jgi:hypothetical protein